MIDGVEWVIVPAVRNWFVLPFFTFWLIGWTIGGAAAIATFVSGEQRGFLAVWLMAWAVGWVLVASWVAWQLGGRHMLAVHSGALVYRWTMPLLSRDKRYDATQLRNLSSFETPNPFGGLMRYDAPPFIPSTMNGGTVKFDYGARTVRLMPGLDEAEGHMIVAWLASKLPRSATQPPQ